MGFYLKKSISIGPFRFNLSKSAIGVSTGFKGLRVGSGPRGNYVHIGRNGIYYRKTFPSQARSLPRSLPSTPSQNKFERPNRQTVIMKEIESADVGQMAHSSSAELLQELNEKNQILRIGPPVTIAVVVVIALALYANLHPFLSFLVFCFGAAAVFLAFWRDVMKKTVILFYEFDAETENAYGLLHSHGLRLAHCQGLWHISASGEVHDRRYHAGASSLVDRKSTTIRKAVPSFLKTNIEVISIDVGRQTLYLFPDRLLVMDSDRVGAVGYDELGLSAVQKRFIEEAHVPRDASVIDHTWRYVNKNGSPDRRFANNRQLPICLYEELHFKSRSGLNEIVQMSQVGAADGFIQAIHYLSQFVAKPKAS